MYQIHIKQVDVLAAFLIFVVMGAKVDNPATQKLKMKTSL